ncbi:PadR family transcriptional regulator PadR [Enterococcus sp. PF1-24]|uniref:PadR family transcriptional regulator n=1 Tax=unclassified Enterococcus TaxID=2608891 RepID=UPI0024750F36|nr:MULTISPECIES: helix-turn-helix transcriptional regulator [unclassified Enterococcus]MDH6363411.1 PadR family transcriptional regulator PadR [Enterococcus sp. PFB1-1]MDH6400505.1 PadR family transcriptional regulator PadR [Enterococcus sp. PF1-24]
MKNIRQQLKKGVLEIIILKLISQEDTYGYKIVKSLAAYENLSIKEGSLYPILYRLEEDGLIESKWLMASDNGKPKKYYCITELGKKELEIMVAEWSSFSQEVTSFLGGE